MLRSFWSPLLRVVGPRLPASLSRACACAGAQFGGAPWRTSVGLGIFRVSASAALFSSTAGGDVSAPVPTPAAVASWSADDLGEFAETHLGLAPDDVEMVKAARLSGRALLKSDMSLLREHGFLLDPSAKLADFADLVRNGPPKAVRVALVGDSEPRPIVLDTQEDVEWLLRSQEASALEDQTGAWKLKLREVGTLGRVRVRRRTLSLISFLCFSLEQLEDGASYAVVANKSRLSKNTVEMLDAESQSKKKGLEQKVSYLSARSATFLHHRVCVILIDNLLTLTRRPVPSSFCKPLRPKVPKPLACGFFPHRSAKSFSRRTEHLWETWTCC